MKTIIGIIGPTGSGKDTAAEFISNRYNIPTYQVSDVLKEIAIRKGASIGSVSLANISRQLSRDHGDDYIARLLLKRVDDVGIITGMRQLGQISYLKKNARLLLIAIDSDYKTRFKRIIERKRPGDPKTLDEFLEVEEEDSRKDVQKVLECMKLADYTIMNDRTSARLYSSIEKILKKEKIIR